MALQAVTSMISIGTSRQDAALRCDVTIAPQYDAAMRCDAMERCVAALRCDGTLRCGDAMLQGGCIAALRCDALPGDALEQAIHVAKNLVRLVAGCLPG